MSAARQQTIAAAQELLARGGGGGGGSGGGGSGDAHWDSLPPHPMPLFRDRTGDHLNALEPIAEHSKKRVSGSGTSQRSSQAQGWGGVGGGVTVLTVVMHLLVCARRLL